MLLTNWLAPAVNTPVLLTLNMSWIACVWPGFKSNNTSLSLLLVSTLPFLAVKAFIVVLPVVIPVGLVQLSNLGVQFCKVAVVETSSVYGSLTPSS